MNIKRIKRFILEEVKNPHHIYGQKEEYREYTTDAMEFPYMGMNHRIRPPRAYMSLYVQNTDKNKPSLLVISTPEWYKLNLPPYINIKGIGKVNLLWCDTPNHNLIRDDKGQLKLKIIRNRGENKVNEINLQHLK